ncbi:MAG: hypothetical protein Kow00109_06900 [Acidobacteriota bacterium]
MGGQTDDSPAAEESAGHLHRQILLAQMNAGGCRAQGEIDAIVHDHYGTAAVRRGLDPFEFLPQDPDGQELRANLEEADSGLEEEVHLLLQGSPTSGRLCSDRVNGSKLPAGHDSEQFTVPRSQAQPGKWGNGRRLSVQERTEPFVSRYAGLQEDPVGQVRRRR